MEYIKVFNKCKKIMPYTIWGKIKDNEIKNERLSIDFVNNLDSLNFLGDNVLKFNSCVDSIWKDKDKSVYYLPRKNIEDFIIKILVEIHNTDEITVQNSNELKNQWNQLLNKKMQNYYVAFPIYGVIVPKVTPIGIFCVYNSSDYKEFIVKNTGLQEETILNMSLFKQGTNYLVLPINAKDLQRAIDLSRPHFELFEYALKFWLKGTKRFDIGIFHYNERYVERGYAFNVTDATDGHFASSSTAKGAFQLINIEEFCSPQMDFFWDILSRYINGTTTEMENRLINAIRWIGIANSADSDVTQYVQYVFALEALLAYKPEKTIITPPISFQLAEYSAFIVGETANEKVTSKKELREEIFKEVKMLYSKRSNIVHGNDSTLNKKDLTNVREIIYNIIYSIMSNKTILNFNDASELSKWIENLRFS